jgi:hypothetical protein
MAETMRARRGPRPAIPYIAVEDASEALRSFRRMTDGLTGRLRFPSLQSMRAGACRSPHGIVLLFLQAGRRAGLPQAWAEQFTAWLRVQVDVLWNREGMSLRESRRRALLAEGRSNEAELNAVQGEESLASLLQERDALATEIAADMTHMSILSARIRCLEASVAGPSPVQGTHLAGTIVQRGASLPQSLSGGEGNHPCGA